MQGVRAYLSEDWLLGALSGIGSDQIYRRAKQAFDMRERPVENGWSNLPGPTKDNPSGSVTTPPGLPISSAIKVLRINLRSDGKPLKALVDVEIPGGIIIRAFRIVETPGKQVVIHCPQACVKPNGKPAYFNTLVILPEPLKQEVNLSILYAWRQALGRQRENSCERLDKPTPENI